MNTIALPLELQDAEHLSALQAVLQRSHAELEGVEKNAVEQALKACNQALELQEAKQVVTAARLAWNEARSELQQQATGLVRQLKKGVSPASVAAVAALLRWSEQPGQRDVVFVDDSDFSLGAYRSRPAFWESAVKASTARQQELGQLVKSVAANLKANPGQPYAPADDATRAKATVDAWQKAVGLIGELGSQAEDLNNPSLYEAALYTSYARAFALNDAKTVGLQYRQGKRNQDSFLRTFTDSMVTAANQMTEQEGLDWHASRVAQLKKPGPR